MTRSIAYVHEPAGSYMGSPTDTDYKVPGANVEVADLSLQNALQRMSVPNQLEYVDAVEQTFEGSIEATWTHTIPWHYDHVFGSAPSQSGTGPYTYSWSFSPGQMASSRWYMGFDHTSGTVERELKGVVFGQYEVSFSVGGAVRVTATGFYGDEARNTSITPGTYVGETAEAMTFDGGTIEIPDSTTLTKVQEGTLTIENISRLQRGMQRKPVDAVVQNPQTSLNLQKIVTDTSQLTLAYGDTTSPVESSNVSGAATGKLTFTTTGTAEVVFDLDTVTPDTYNWANLANKDEDVLEDVDYLVNSVTVDATSDESSAL